MQSLSNLKASLERTRQLLAWASTEAGGDTGVQAQEQSSWATVKRGGGESVKKASFGLEHPNKYTLLCDVGETSQGAALLEQSAKGKERRILVVGDSVIRRTEGAICYKDRKC